MAWKNQDFAHCPLFLGILARKFFTRILLGIKLGIGIVLGIKLGNPALYSAIGILLGIKTWQSAFVPGNLCATCICTSYHTRLNRNSTMLLTKKTTQTQTHTHTMTYNDNDNDNNNNNKLD